MSDVLRTMRPDVAAQIEASRAEAQAKTGRLRASIEAVKSDPVGRGFGCEDPDQDCIHLGDVTDQKPTAACAACVFLRRRNMKIAKGAE